MNKLTPIALAIAGSGLIGACSTPPARQELTMQPLLRIDSGTRAGNQIGTWNRLGRYHQERGQLSLALGAYAQSLALDPRQLEARTAVAAIEARQGRLEAAREQLQALVAEYPAEAQAHTNLGYVQYLLGEYSDAIGTLRKAMALGAGPKAFENLQLAETAVRENKEPGAAAMAAALKVQPASVAQGSAGMEAATTHAVGMPPARAGSAEADATPDASRLENNSRMQLVQLQENVYELKLRPAVTAVPPQRPAIVKATPAMPATPAATTARAGASAAAGARRARMEIANGNGSSGMAKRFRDLLLLSGMAIERLSNDKPYRQQLTTIQYGPGYASQAVELQSTLQGKAALEASNALQAVELRLVLGKDAPATLAAASPPAATTLMASSAPD
ncbi:LytR C-terminal domain-containing protein [Massilia sp. NR 4-1]|uniref:LytR C-terminal domain-containing protein n=1 Tax=Massilia sp. NR 4-1 TaxID=1678028 RepID=UPI00067ABAA3|nr:LytR C-terminal domain-containing protein [Massilia sp. NR 4-1]AKU20347.1 hypothetical protein ACZ75_01175 [Massilia sp. NR 4-1]